MKIRQSSSFLNLILKDVASGRLLPAAMQRPYVWRKADVEALCDSILSGFPIGAFLMWAPGSKADIAQLARARLGPIEARGVADGSVSLLLDGQNRLSTLAWMMASEPPALADLSPAEVDTWTGPERLVLDFGTRALKFVPAQDAEVGLRLPAWTVVCGSGSEQHPSAMSLVRRLAAGSWAAHSPEDEVNKFLDFWDRCRDRFADARTTETVIEDATVDEARHAFLRICRVGVPMSQVDFDVAVGWQSSLHDSFPK